MSFGSNLIALRESRNVTRKELAEQLGIPYTTLRNYENDKREPGHQFLVSVADLFGISVDELVGRDPYKNENPAPSPKEAVLLGSFHQLNDEGQDKLVDTADDMVRSGKYDKKAGPAGLVQEA